MSITGSTAQSPKARNSLAPTKCFLDMLGVFAEFETTSGESESLRASPTSGLKISFCELSAHTLSVQKGGLRYPALFDFAAVLHNEMHVIAASNNHENGPQTG